MESVKKIKMNFQGFEPNHIDVGEPLIRRIS